MGRTSAAVGIAMACLVGSASAGPTTGQIRGKVTDKDGKPLENVTVTLVGSATSGRPTLTDENGEFRFFHLNPGHYTVWADEHGPRVAWRGVGVRPGTTSRVTITVRTSSERDELDLFAPDLENGVCEEPPPVPPGEPRAGIVSPSCRASART
jgi:hypothetical protein